MGNRGERVELVDRKVCIELIEEAVVAGATRAAASSILEISARTVERWKNNSGLPDGRAGPIAPSLKSLSVDEIKMIIDVSNLPTYRDLCPWKIVAKLADSGTYLASESSFYRVLKKANLMKHRNKNKPAERKRPKELSATKPNSVWSWDITYCKSPVKGIYYYLYLMMDIYSRYIVGYEVHEVESSDHAANLIAQACGDQNVRIGQLTPHSDNGDPMKDASMLATLQKLQVVPSFSRPSVSDDNPFSESLFKTLKYRPSYPDGAFASIEETRTWVKTFVHWYNTEHLHSGIKFVTPKSRHEGRDEKILENRHEVYENAKLKNPLRWSGQTRNWNPITEVKLNPGKEKKPESEMFRKNAA